MYCKITIFLQYTSIKDFAIFPHKKKEKKSIHALREKNMVQRY